MKQFFSLRKSRAEALLIKQAHAETDQIRRRTSLIFRATDRLPSERKGDRAVHRLYHHYYEDLLM